MVKFEDVEGLTVYVNPEHVSTLNVSANSEGTSIWDVGGTHLDVKGTPDEVHAKLFPALSMSARSVIAEAERQSQDVVCVLEWVATGNGFACPDNVIALARKALGREGT